MSADAGPTGNPESARIVLARVAERAVGRMPGVELAARQIGWSTVSGTEMVRGVAVVAQAGGIYELDVHVIVAWPIESLHRLAADLRGRIRDAAERAGHAALVGEIDVSVEDLELPEEA